MCKMVTAGTYFFIFEKLWFSGHWADKMTKNGPERTKDYIPSHVISQEQYSVRSWFLIHLCKMISPGVFLFFSKLLLGGLKGKKWPKWQQIMSVELHISGSIHHMIVVYGTHMENANISRNFFSFSKFDFLSIKRVKRAKYGPKWQIILSVAVNIWGTIHHMIVIYDTHV